MSESSVLAVFVDVVGWLGAIALLVAYGSVSSGRLRGKSASFQALNVLGSAALTVNTAYHHAWPSAALNVVWMAVGLFALAREAR